MPERGFSTELWNDTFVRKLPKDAKLLFVYLWTNPHCNQAGLYEIDPETIAFETKLAEVDIPSLLELLEPKVKWYPETNLVWVKNFIKRQAKSPKFLIAVAKCLNLISNNGAVQELIEYNYSIHSISIPYPYSISSIPIPTNTNANTNADLDLLSKSKGVNSLILSYKGKEDEDLAEMSRLYEQNIGTLTPIIAEELKELRRTYPVHWFEEAVKKAASYNKRNLKYIEAILERWKVEGFQTPKTSNRSKKEDDSDKYIKQKYGHLVQR
jgi:DnaD/phage-associated family protein